jgi:hypothetical protein
MSARNIRYVRKMGGRLIWILFLVHSFRGWPEIRQYLSTIGETMASMHLCEMDIPKKYAMTTIFWNGFCLFT